MTMRSTHGICPNCGEAVRPGFATCGDPQCEREQGPVNGALRAGCPYVTLDAHDGERWGDIEVELANLRNAARAAECLAEADDERIMTSGGTDLTAALRFLAVGLDGRIDKLTRLLGLYREEGAPC